MRANARPLARPYAARDIGAIPLAGFLETGVVGAFQIVLDHARDPVDSADSQILVQHLGPELPAGRELQLRAELRQVWASSLRQAVAGGVILTPSIRIRESFP